MADQVEPLLSGPFPAVVRAYLYDANVTVIKKKTRSSVYRIQNHNNDLFLKINLTAEESIKRMSSPYWIGCLPSTGYVTATRIREIY